MTPDSAQQSHYLVSMREWLAKEPHLPNKDIDDLLLRKFLHSCYWSQERTKECIEKFCTSRCYMNEVYIGRDPLSPQLKATFAITKVAAYWTPAKQEVLIHQLNDPGLEKFLFYDLLKAFTIIGECWMSFHKGFPDEHIVVLDVKDYSLKIVSKVNLMFLKQFFTYLMEAVPVRLTQIHLVNCPAIMDKLFTIVKPMLPAKICELVNFHPTVEGLYKFIDRKSLPIEYGGEAESLMERNEKWLKEAEDNRAFFLNDDRWKSDLKIRRKDVNTLNVMNGSFRTLDID